MLRFLFALVATVSGLSVASATPPDDAARKVRVALALSGGCGTCRVDVEECRADAIRTGKPLVLFVGGCDGRAKELDGAAIYCRVAEYRIESKPVVGIVVLGKLKGEKDALFILAQLPKASTPAEIRAAVKVALGKAPTAGVALDWDFGGDAPADDDDIARGGATIARGGVADARGGVADDDDDGLQPIATQFQPVAIQSQSCPGGRCPVATAAVQSVSARVATAGQAVATARQRVLQGRPVRSFFCRLFGLNRSR